MAPKQTHKDLVHRAWEIVGNSVEETLFQPTGTSLSFAQLYAHEYQNAFDKYWLSGRVDMPNGLIRVSPSARVVGLSISARLDSPKIDPGYHGRVIFLEGECTKRWKMSDFVDNESILGDHDL